MPLSSFTMKKVYNCILPFYPGLMTKETKCTTYIQTHRQKYFESYTPNWTITISLKEMKVKLNLPWNSMNFVTTLVIIVPLNIGPFIFASILIM